MHRRQMMASIAAVSAGLVALPAFAQSSAGAGKLGERETKYMKDTGMVGSLSLATSRVAERKASDAMVKQFAGFETEEQETVADVLMAIKAPADEAQGALKKPTDAELAKMMGPENQEKLSKLEGMSGAAFDKEYVTAQLDGHRKLKTIQEDYLKVGQNREALAVAKLARAHIDDHIAILTDLKSKMG